MSNSVEDHDSHRSARPYGNTLSEMASYHGERNAIRDFCEQLALNAERPEFYHLFASSWDSCLIQAPLGSGKTSLIPFLALDHGHVSKVVVTFPSLITLQAFVRICVAAGYQEIAAFSLQANSVLPHPQKQRRPTNVICTTAGCLNYLLDYNNLAVDYVIFDECHKSDMLTDAAIHRCLKRKLKTIFMTATLDEDEASHLGTHAESLSCTHRLFTSVLSRGHIVRFWDCNFAPVSSAEYFRPPDVSDHDVFAARLLDA
uniref:Helicase ATP-binding domain-containing protein n=1 Tax=Panagrolaimus sp. ES5 TaxID=591445 RepID=A0AC34G8V5_9BILA